MTERGSGWRESVDHVVSDFDVVTRHLRVRQGQALRVAWSVVVATAIAVGAFIALSLRPSSPAFPIAGIPATPGPLALSQPGAVLVPSDGIGFLTPTPDTSPAGTATPGPAAADIPRATPAPAPRPATPAPVVTVQVPVPAPVTTVTAPPSAPVASPAPRQGVVDGLVNGVLKLVG